MVRRSKEDALYTRYKIDPRTGEPNPHYKRHGGKSGRSGKSGRNRNATEAGNFIAWDGEGWDVNGRHEYTMLVSSRGDELINPRGLDTYSCLLFLLKASTKYPSNARHVIYSGNYDVNMMLRDLSREDLYTLWKTKKLTWRGLEIGYRHRKEFTVKLPKRTADGKPVWKVRKVHEGTPEEETISTKEYAASIVLWDVIGFYQGPFVDTLRKNLDIPQADLDAIKGMKGKRSDFTAGEVQQILDYCRQEVRYLERLMVDLVSKLNHPSVALTLSRWDGAGAVASAIYKKHKTKDHMDKLTHTHRRKTPPEHLRTFLESVGMPSVNEAAQFAYSGGRIENFQYGYYEGDVYHYDLVSAYPAAISTLPCLACGRWRWVDQYIPGSFGMWLVQWDYRGKSKATGEYPNKYVQPFFFRTTKGNIIYPPMGAGFYWTPEVQAAVENTPHDMFSIGGGWVYESRCKHTPFAFVPEMFAERRRLKDAGDGAQLVLKLGLNSLYGKMIQQIGFNDGRPPYHQLEWGGYVTAWTRAKLYNAAMQDPLATICIMTDGIYATTPLQLEEGDQLGQWEPNVHDAMLCVQAGVYYVRDKGKWGTVKFRGFDKDTFPTPEDIRRAYATGVRSLPVKSTRFVGMGSALSSDSLYREWRQWPTRERELQLYPVWGHGKRYEVDKPTKRRHPGTCLFRSEPFYDVAHGLEHEGLGLDGRMLFSAPYKLRWTEGEDDGTDEQYGPDGVPIRIYNDEAEDTEYE